MFMRYGDGWGFSEKSCVLENTRGSVCPMCSTIRDTWFSRSFERKVLHRT